MKRAPAKASAATAEEDDAEVSWSVLLSGDAQRHPPGRSNSGLIAALAASLVDWMIGWTLRAAYACVRGLNRSAVAFWSTQTWLTEVV